MPQNYTKKLRRYNEDDVQNALKMIRDGSSIRKASRTCGMSEHMLRYTLKKRKLWQHIESREWAKTVYSCRYRKKTGRMHWSFVQFGV